MHETSSSFVFVYLTAAVEEKNKISFWIEKWKCGFSPSMSQSSNFIQPKMILI